MAAGRTTLANRWLAALVPMLLLLLASHQAAASPAALNQQQRGDPLGLIAPGLTADTLCPLIKSQPDTAIGALASGAARAYDQGQQHAYAQAMGAAVAAANSHGCINELFEVVNQAIMRGGYKVEVVTGRALALGSAAGAGPVLAQATAVVMCNGGASAVACAKAWAQAVQMDGNGCLFLVQAFSQARAQCGPGFASSEAKTSIWKTPLGVCNVPTYMVLPMPMPGFTPAGQFPSWFNTPTWFHQAPAGFSGHRRMLRGHQPSATAASTAGHNSANPAGLDASAVLPPALPGSQQGFAGSS